MTTLKPTPDTGEEGSAPISRDAAFWSPHATTLAVANVPMGATNLNVHGRLAVGPLQGFGRMWQKTYRVRLAGAVATPIEVVKALKERLPEFQPPQNRFFPPLAGVRPGEVVLINASLTGLPLDTGVMVLYADEESFTLMTPQGHPESGWVTFSAYDEGGVTVTQIQSIARANDPIYEVGFRFGGSRAQERIWTHVLTALATHFGVVAPVDLAKACVDPRCQWSQARNIWHNAAIRTGLYVALTPVRWARGRAGRR